MLSCETGSFKSQRVGYDGERTKRHRPRGQHRAQLNSKGREEHSSGDGDENDVIRERPEQFPPDRSERRPANRNRAGNTAKVASYQGDIRRFHRNIRSNAHRDSEIGLCRRLQSVGSVAVAFYYQVFGSESPSGALINAAATSSMASRVEATRRRWPVPLKTSINSPMTRSRSV